MLDSTEMKRRDAVLRAYLGGRGWDVSPELELMQELVRRSHELLPGFPYLVDHEWEVAPGHANQGRGDLVFAAESGALAVVEVKYIDLETTGHTAQVKRTKARRKVVTQARVYAAAMRERAQGDVSVVAATWTNEDRSRVIEVSGGQSPHLV